MSSKHAYYPKLEEGFGIIRKDPELVYKWCEEKQMSVVVIRDGENYDKTRYLENIFDSIINVTEIQIALRFVSNPYDVLLYFLKVHKAFHKDYTPTADRKTFQKRYWPSDVICLELTSYLSAHMEYIITMYMYLYNRGIIMPQFYVIIDYPTQDFNFISTDIFDRQEPGWTVPNFIPKLGVESNPMAVRTTGALSIQKFGDELRSGARIVIISSNGLYERKIKEGIADKQPQPQVFQDIISYLKTPFSDVPSIILMNTPEDLIYWKERFPIEEKLQTEENKKQIEGFRVSLVVYDPTIKVPKNTLYTGNHHMPMIPNANYQKTSYWKLALLPFVERIEMYSDTTERQVVVRGIFEISPIQDIVLFLKYSVRFGALYANYQKRGGSRMFTSIIRSETDLLSELNIDNVISLSSEDPSKKLDQKEVVIRLSVHPIMVSIIQKWFERGYPRFSILVFVATMMTTSGKFTEIREPGTREYDNDISQTSRYGQVFFDFLKLCASMGDPYPKEGGRTSKLLLRLSELYGTLGEEYLPDHNEFHIHLVKLISEDFKPYILHRLSHSTYRSVHSSQRNWTISQTVQSPEFLFPLSAIPTSTNMYVPLFVPIDRIGV
jgi:hypothetical protein